MDFMEFLSVKRWPWYWKGVDGIFRKQSVKACFTSRHSKSLLKSPKGKLHTEQSLEIYRITSGECSKIYAGQTKRSLNKIRNVKTKNTQHILILR